MKPRYQITVHTAEYRTEIYTVTANSRADAEAMVKAIGRMSPHNAMWRIVLHDLKHDVAKFMPAQAGTIG
jgi:DNA-binding XRE family transcriptional regulator